MLLKLHECQFYLGLKNQGTKKVVPQRAETIKATLNYNCILNAGSGHIVLDNYISKLPNVLSITKLIIFILLACKYIIAALDREM